jgi:hypothetical protein
MVTGPPKTDSPEPSSTMSIRAASKKLLFEVV